MTENSSEIAKGKSSDTTGEYPTLGVEGEEAELSTNFVAERNVQTTPDDHPTDEKNASWDPGTEEGAGTC